MSAEVMLIAGAELFRLWQILHSLLFAAARPESTSARALPCIYFARVRARGGRRRQQEAHYGRQFGICAERRLLNPPVVQTSGAEGQTGSE